MNLSKFLPDVRAPIENLLEVLSKEGTWVPFRLNSVQAKLAEERRKRTVILKARQMGVTTYIMAENICTCLALENVRCAMIAHDRDHTVKLMRRLRMMLERLNQRLKAAGLKEVKLRRESDYEIEFMDTRSTIFIGTAGSRHFGRSDTIHRLHCSEVAFWPSPEDQVAGLLQAVPREGVVYYESTANGLNYFYKLWNSKGLKKLFFPWSMFPEYRIEPPPDFELTDEERQLKLAFGLDEGQLAWRREKLAEFSGRPELFRQEYPLTPEEAFIASGRPVFPELTFITAGVLDQSSFYGWEKFVQLGDHPKGDWEYVFGVDPAGGTGGDYTAVVGAGVSPAREIELVLVARDRFVRPADLGSFLVELGERWNKALLVIERNSLGLAVLDQLLSEGYPTHRVWREFIKRRDKFGKTIQALEYGIYTGRKKGLIVASGQAFYDELGGVWDADLLQELQEYMETASGRFEGSGDHDDLAMAFCLCGFGVRHLFPAMGSKRRKKEGVQVKSKEQIRDFKFTVSWEDIFRKPKDIAPWVFVQ